MALNHNHQAMPNAHCSCPPQHYHSRCSLHCCHKAKQAWSTSSHIHITLHLLDKLHLAILIMPVTPYVTTPTQPLVLAKYYSMGLMPLLICPVISHPTCGTVSTLLCTVSPGFHALVPALKPYLHPPSTYAQCPCAAHFKWP